MRRDSSLGNWRETARLIDLTVTGWKAHAFDYLTAHGQLFCMDFGTENAVAKARAHRTARKRRKNR
jgi:hypothetical protein